MGRQNKGNATERLWSGSQEQGASKVSTERDCQTYILQGRETVHADKAGRWPLACRPLVLMVAVAIQTQARPKRVASHVGRRAGGTPSLPHVHQTAIELPLLCHVAKLSQAIHVSALHCQRCAPRRYYQAWQTCTHSLNMTICSLIRRVRKYTGWTDGKQPRRARSQLRYNIWKGGMSPCQREQCYPDRRGQGAGIRGSHSCNG